MSSTSKPSKPSKVNSKDGSMDRLRNQLEQAKIDGNTGLVRMIQAIIDRVKSLS